VDTQNFLFFLRTLIVIFDADDVVLAEITPGLDLDQFELDLAGILQSVDRADRDIDRFVLVHGFDIRSDGDLGGAAHHHPVLCAMVVLLQRQHAARTDHDAFDLEALTLVDAEQLIQKVLELGQGGDVSCLRLDRLWPLRKGQPINLDMPRINTSNDLLTVMASIWNAIGDGRLTPDEASALSLVAERSMQIIQLQDVVKRIGDLEKKVGSNR